MTGKGTMRWLLLLSLLSFLPVAPVRVLAWAQEQSSTQDQAAPKHDSRGGELAKQEREAAGEEEENANLKYSAAVQFLARHTGLNVHQAHWLALGLNFALVAFVVYWFTRKSVPRLLRSRSESIQRALEEARAASQEANRRLAEIETRLRQLDAEIGQMQAAAEKEAEAEEDRIQKAAEEDIRKVAQAAEQEIVTAAKQARRELTEHTADLAIALARKQINVDAGTDQALVRSFAGQLSSQDGGKDRN